jgi:ketosteroid isomerase-like protein
MAHSPDPVEVVSRFLSAVEAGDIDRVRSVYDPDAVVWHSNDGLEQSVDENLTTLTFIANNLTLRYTNVRRYGFTGGVVEQHDTIVTIPGRDEPYCMPACLVVLVDDEGRITRIDEYLDSSAITGLTALLASTA